MGASSQVRAGKCVLSSIEYKDTLYESHKRGLILPQRHCPPLERLAPKGSLNLARTWLIFLGWLCAVVAGMQVLRLEYLSFNPLAFFDNGFAAAGVDVSRCDVVEPCMGKLIIVVINEDFGLDFKFTGRK